MFAYSDVSNQYVMEKAALVNSLGAHFTLAGAAPTMVKSVKPVISICAVRTGSGKSQTTRRVADILIEAGYKVVAIRHPMPYGNLAKQKVQRFATLDDLVKHECTIEEIEEYEPHIVKGVIVYAGVDYEAILRTGGEGSGRRPLGRRQQRSAVLQAGSAHRRRRSAPPRA